MIIDKWERGGRDNLMGLTGERGERREKESFWVNKRNMNRKVNKDRVIFTR